MVDFVTLFMFSPRCRRWFSIQKNQLVYQKKFKVYFEIIVAILFEDSLGRA